ncbi:protein of unknown function DUF86 [Caldalkalibacillus thermarum TA2.A1]|uniref:Nucleotidyltransferase n=2 Tax=Caldalkalibacillus TaxID=379065 RepID=F5L2Z1_CALTT|nr:MULTISPECIES: DUF86 domain-containing protein [Caldalkalibacillus]EGL84288.1 protein of unknown function DUF86 [Caldalkalibacillus thermarum TA2.A1]MDQ0338146.1 uncharacterized protein with HEPN domain [Caldalkalibacillus uzonensis]
MTKKYIMFLEDILKCIDKIEEYTKGMDFEKFRNNQLVIDAVIRNLEVIGEASKYVPDEIRESYPSVPWKSMIGLRNILIHEYFGIDEEIVWEIVSSDLKKIKPVIEEIIRNS